MPSGSPVPAGVQARATLLVGGQAGPPAGTAEGGLGELSPLCGELGSPGAGSPVTGTERTGMLSREKKGLGAVGGGALSAPGGQCPAAQRAQPELQGPAVRAQEVQADALPPEWGAACAVGCRQGLGTGWGVAEPSGIRSDTPRSSEICGQRRKQEGGRAGVSPEAKQTHSERD